MKLHLMRATLLLSSLLLFFSSFSQNNYIEANSVAGIEVKQGGGSSSICPTYKSEFSTTSSTDKFFFTAIECSAAYLKFEIFNNTSGAVKVTIKNQSGTSIVETRVIAAGNSTGQMLLPTYVVNYLWKFETSTIPVSFVNDVISLDSNVGALFQPKNNDIAVPVNTGYRLKAGQTMTIANVAQYNPILSELIISPIAVGTQTVVIEAYNTVSNTVLGESNLAITVTAPCSFSITNIVQAGIQTYNVTLSSNRTTRPYFYQVINSQSIVVKSGNTSAVNLTNTELIDVGDIPSGNYTLRMVSTSQALCGDVTKTFAHTNSADICTMNGSAIRSVNSFVVTLPVISGVSAYDFVLKTPSDSVIVQGIATGTTKSFDFSGRQDGIYTLFLKPSNSTKICSQTLNLTFTSVNSSNSRGYLKKYNNIPDFFEIAGAGDFGGVKDAGTGWVVRENRNTFIWQTFTKALSNSTNARAIITIREDSSNTSRHISIAALNNKLQVIQRTTKATSNVIVSEKTGTTLPVWLRIERNGNTAVLKYSVSAPTSDDPTWITISTVQNAFAGWKPNFYKGLYTTSASVNNLVSAEFHRFLGGVYTGTDNAIDNSPLTAPTLAASNLTPTANASVTLTASACKNGYLIHFFKNGTEVGTGSSLGITVTYGDSYKARCEKGIDVSGYSNTITFSAPTQPTNPTTPVLCGITDGLKLGTKIVGTTPYDMYARIFNNKLWLTQSLNTTPESFLVRAVNFVSITFTKSWTGSDYSCFEGQVSGYGGVVEPTGFATPTGYTLTTTADGAKIYTLGTVDENGGGGGTPPTNVAAFQNKIKLVPIEQTNGKYSPHLFDKISTVVSTDAAIGKAFPNWAVAWQVEGGNFKNNNRKPQDVGISFNYDHNPLFYNGIGDRCVDYIYETNPNTGGPWVDDIDTYCGTANKKWTTFISAIPFYERAFSGYGAAGDGKRNEWINNSAEWAFDQGIESAQARRLGQGDKSNGKVNVGVVNADIEIGLEMGHDYLPRHLAFLLGGGSATQGYFFSQYSAPINGVGAELSTYPDDQGNYPATRKNIDGSTIYEGSSPAVNNIPTSWDWNTSNKITLNGRITNKGVIDYPNVLPCIEISSTSDMTYKHGQIYARKGGWKYESQVINGETVWVLSYSPSNPVDNTTVDKFGMDRNTNHIIADIINYGDVNKDYSVRKLGNRKVFLQSKITCDRAHEGVFLDAGFTNQALKFKHFDREYSFDIGGFTALTGCEWQIWDRNYDQNLDGYHGAFGLINLMHQRVNGGKSFVDLKPSLTFLLHNSEVSYNNGTTYVKNKATDYILSENNLPQRQALSSDGYWVIFAARPEGVEPTSAKFRIQYNGTWYYHSITANDWETVDYAYKDAALSTLPLASKDYYFAIIKLGSVAVDGGTSVTAPTIQSNPVNPISGNNVTFTASGCSGTVKWWLTDTQIGTGTTYSVSNASANSSYFATCTVGSVSSSASNTINIGTNEVPVFVFWGESNAGTRNLFSTANSNELGVRNGVRILNNSNNTLETLNIATTQNGGNSSYGENDCTANENWGWEVPAANYFASGALQKPELIIVKVAQGGSFIGQWNDDISGGYYSIAQARINVVKAQLANEGKVPKWYIFYSQGINNATPSGQTLTDPSHFPNLSGINYWGAATSTLFPKILAMTSTSAKIAVTKFGPTQYGDYLNSKIDEICNGSGGKYIAVSPTGLSVQGDQLHWDAASTKTLFGRMLTAHGL
ncbi:hypothetical protein LV89_02006 [Arcicella aurantiaca]|uniref:Sialate O-acetylesterase domain-containing protein n=1 Tax=Arcicella aurantiaca TaxID=591202 RepID=A0A316EB67_9BACT|nr:hypothetical protein [Arcicella aurantiaca]PWK27191.1 hypothetical protein LV89_02006 [Arcicella aurantiaca]